MVISFQHAYPPAQAPIGTTSALWFPFQKDRMIVQMHESTDGAVTLLQGDETLLAPVAHGEVLYLGTLGEHPCLTCAVDAEEMLPEGWKALNIRELFGYLSESSYGIVGYASQILHWQRISRFCPVCTTATESIPGSWGRLCPHCGHSSYPPVIPAIIVLIHKDESILMAHKRGWGRRYGLIAGFVEPGESLEECVRREIREEAGLEVDEVRYAASQPWPFPSQLMIGFTAHYSSGTAHPDEDELDEVAWFTRDTLPQLPPPLSLAHTLITAWLHTQQPQHTQEAR
ncbi:MAG: NAD(+) diphosphatase [Ktedonobacteraceae bacterium]